MTKKVSIASLLLVLTACSSSPHDGAPASYVKFVKPEDRAVLTGLADVRVDISVPETISKYEVGVDGQMLTEFQTITGTLQLNTTNMDNGPKTLVIKATGESGHQWSDSVDVEIKNASHQLVSYKTSAQTYAKGEQVILDLTYPVANLKVSADFKGIDDTFNSSGVSVSDLGAGKYELTYTISASDKVAPGERRISLSATNAANETVTTPLDLQLRDRPRLPLDIPGATFVDNDSAPVVAGVSSAPSIQGVSGSKQLLSGTPGNINITWTQPSDQPADRLVVRSADYSGYLVLPVDGVTAQQAAVPLQLAAKPTSSMSKKTLDLLLAMIDATGATGAWTPYTLGQQILEPTGTLVTLWWDNPVDIDLQVKTPLGNTVSYSSPSVDGGKLELDSNSMCILDYINTERISWPMGAASSGTYTVIAKLYDSCGQTGANFHALISVCGKLQEVEGSFVAADKGTANATKQIATFDVNCANRAHGRVQYEQPKALRDNNIVPAAFVPVRAVADSGGYLTVLAQSTTNDQGQFDFFLPDNTPSNYVLEVEASWTPPGEASPRAQVQGVNDGQVYRIFTNVDLASQTSTAGQEIRIDVAHQSGAMNILDKLRRGYSWVSGHFNVADVNKVIPITAHWTLGQPAPGSTGSYYSPGANIYIGGAPTDQGEFDDPVISHEFMHHVTNHVMGAGPGGSHSFEKRATPTLAWNEGIATAFGQQSLGTPIYTDVNSNWAYFLNIEESWSLANTQFAFADRGTSDNTMSGDVGEVLVAMVLWDLLDPVGGTTDPFDNFEPTYAQTLGSVTGYLPRANRSDRGVWGKDLVDFLDGWRCQWPTLTQRDSDLYQLLMDRSFWYDYSTSIKCK